ncbi:expressed protein [Phakopsora pachyrhizi]|uniref:Expressed protein n=1 Tax=Phakopsora pachyrhizi TaxID=170000 RepID=A0AAV0BBZ3_PHAPC|nr:expressed protein [Phakopsora pachyrhizi]
MSTSLSGSASDLAYLELISELLAPANLSSDQAAIDLDRLQLLFVQATSHSKNQLVSQVIRTLHNSPGIWSRVGVLSGNPLNQLGPPSLRSSKFFYITLSRSILFRSDVIKRNCGNGCRARYRLRLFVEALKDGLRDEDGSGGLTLRRLTILSALLSSIDVLKESHGPIILLGSSLSSRTQDEFLIALNKFFDPSHSPNSYVKSSQVHEDDDHTQALVWLVSQVIPSLDPSKLRDSTGGDHLIRLLSAHLNQIVFRKDLIGSLQTCLVLSQDSINLSNHTKASEALKLFINDPLLSVVRDISSSLSKIIENETRPVASLEALSSVFELTEEIRSKWEMVAEEAEWGQLPPLEAKPTESSGGANHRDELKMWLNCLFLSVVAITGGVANRIYLGSSSGSSPSKAHSLDFLRLALLALRSLHFVAIRFPPGSLPTHRNAFITLTGLLRRYETQLPQLIKQFHPPFIGEIDKNPVRRAGALYYFDVVEQLAPSLTNTYLRSYALPAIKPYLTHPLGGESAHAAVIGLLPQLDHESINEFGDLYFNLITSDSVKLYLNESQIRLAFQTLIKAANGVGNTSLSRWFSDLILSLNKLDVKSQHRIRTVEFLVDIIQIAEPAMIIDTKSEKLERVWGVLRSVEEVKIFFEGISEVEDRNGVVKWWLEKRKLSLSNSHL